MYQDWVSPSDLSTLQTLNIPCCDERCRSVAVPSPDFFGLSLAVDLVTQEQRIALYVLATGLPGVVLGLAFILYVSDHLA